MPLNIPLTDFGGMAEAFGDLIREAAKQSMDTGEKVALDFSVARLDYVTVIVSAEEQYILWNADFDRVMEAMRASPFIKLNETNGDA